MLTLFNLQTLRRLWRERRGHVFFAGHLLTVWAIAASNAFQGLMILWSGWRRRSLPWREAAWGRPPTSPGPDARVLLVPLGFYVLFLVVSTTFSLEPAISAEHLREIFSLATLPLALVLVRGERDVRRLVDLLIGMVACLAVWGLLQYALTDYGTLHKRIVGPFSHYQTFAGVLLLGDFLLLARLVAPPGGERPSHRVAALGVAALAVINWTLLLTLTRGPWVSLGLTFAAYVVVRGRRYMVAFVTSAAVLVLAAALLAPAAFGRMRSIVDLRDPSNYDRLCMLEAGFYMVSERPLFGVGPGMVEERYPIYRHPTAPRLTVPHLHNAFAELAAERGLASLAVYLWLMGSGLGVAYRAYRREGGLEGARADLYTGVILALVGFNLAGLFEDNWRDTEVQRLVLFLLAAPLCLRSRGGGDDEDGW